MGKNKSYSTLHVTKIDLLEAAKADISKLLQQEIVAEKIVQ